MQSSESNNQAPPPTHGPLAAIMWGLFLGCSWTWVIGMFFPVLLLRDYGLWGWVAFATPNVLGAAAMGYVLKDRAASLRITEKHRTACRWFGWITVAYQAYLIGALAGPFGLTAAGVLTLAILLIGRADSQRDTWIALATFAVSLGLFAYAQTTGRLWSKLDPAAFTGQLNDTDFLLFIPAAVFGFLLCPYLDLTFHRARQATTPGTGKAAFTLGFCGVFFSMIVFSLAYAGAFENVTTHIGFDIAPKLWPVLLVQLVVQGAFTTAVHIRSLTPGMTPGMATGASSEVTSGTGAEGKRAEFVLFIVLIIAVSLGLAALLMDRLPILWPEGYIITSATELLYRGFLLLYGTVLPGYVFLCIIPTYRQVSHKAKIGVFAAAAALSYPLACAAFIAGRSYAVLAILVVMVVARIAIEMLPKRNV